MEKGVRPESPCTGAPPRGGYRGGGRAQGGQLQLVGRAGPGPRRVFDEPEDVEFVRVMKGHTKHITALAVDHGSSQVRAYSLDGLSILTLKEKKSCDIRALSLHMLR